MPWIVRPFSTSSPSKWVWEDLLLALTPAQATAPAAIGAWSVREFRGARYALDAPHRSAYGSDP